MLVAGFENKMEFGHMDQCEEFDFTALVVALVLICRTKFIKIIDIIPEPRKYHP